MHLLLLTIQQRVNDSFIKLVHEASPIDKSLFQIGSVPAIDGIDTGSEWSCHISACFNAIV
ncbi:MAG: hypothetical protein GY737_07410 [Desulfobacteraceae bacterium]|nr:hypothetical protein [Desulfobacteraceae bacterium]